MASYYIETQNADGVDYWWDGDGWTKTKVRACSYSKTEAEETLEHIRSVSFGARIENARVVHA